MELGIRQSFVIMIGMVLLVLPSGSRCRSFLGSRDGSRLRRSGLTVGVMTAGASLLGNSPRLPGFNELRSTDRQANDAPFGTLC